MQKMTVILDKDGFELSYAEAASKLHVSVATIRTRLSQRRKEGPSETVYLHELNQNVTRHRITDANGKWVSYATAARELECSPATVYRHVGELQSRGMLKAGQEVTVADIRSVMMPNNKISELVMEEWMNALLRADEPIRREALKPGEYVIVDDKGMGLNPHYVCSLLSKNYAYVHRLIKRHMRENKLETDVFTIEEIKAILDDDNQRHWDKLNQRAVDLGVRKEDTQPEDEEPDYPTEGEIEARPYGTKHPTHELVWSPRGWVPPNEYNE